MNVDASYAGKYPATFKIHCSLKKRWQLLNSRHGETSENVCVRQYSCAVFKSRKTKRVPLLSYPELDKNSLNFRLLIFLVLLTCLPHMPFLVHCSFASLSPLHRTDICVTAPGHMPMIYSTMH